MFIAREQAHCLGRYRGQGRRSRNRELAKPARRIVGLSKQRKVGLEWHEFLFLKVPLCDLRPSIIISVPCDRIVQRAWLLVGFVVLRGLAHDILPKQIQTSKPARRLPILQ